VSKVKITNNDHDELNYILDKNLLESLYTLRSKENLPILEGLKLLQDSEVNSISFSRDKPFHFFYARKNKNNFDITIREYNKEVEFQIPVKTFKQY
jgi:hypothetical protein